MGIVEEQLPAADASAENCKEHARGRCHLGDLGHPRLCIQIPSDRDGAADF